MRGETRVLQASKGTGELLVKMGSLEKMGAEDQQGLKETGEREASDWQGLLVSWDLKG